MSYKEPYVPSGFIHVYGEWNTGFVIEHIESGSRFTWVPLAILPDIYNRFNQAITKEAISVNDEYHIRQMLQEKGGIYFSSYPISKVSGCKPMSVKQEDYWNLISFNQSKTEAVEMGKELNNSITRLPYGWEYDAIVDTIRVLRNTDTLFECHFEKFALYDMNVLWFWTLQKYSNWSKVVKRGDSRQYEEDVYANSDYQGYKEIGFRTVLMVDNL